MIARMDEFALRMTALVRVLVPFLFFMAAVYLGLHIVFAHFVADERRSATLWFFSVVTGPLTRPVRAMLPTGTPEPRVRAVALAVYLGLWLASRVVVSSVLPDHG
jgi:hypothetical protein